MSDRPEPTHIDRAVPVNGDTQDVLRFLTLPGPVPVNGDTQDVLRFLALPGPWIGPARHSEDLVSFFPITRHRATSLRLGLPDTWLRYVQHDGAD